MNKKQEDKLDAFDDFEELPELEKDPLNKITIGPTGDPIADAAFQKETLLTELSLNVALSVLQGDISLILTMASNEKQELLDFLTVRCNSGSPSLGNPQGFPTEKEPISSPSAEVAAKVVQTPEEKKREQEFLDTLGI